MTALPAGIDAGAVADWLGLMYEGTSGYVQVVSTGNWAGRTFSVDQLTRGAIVDHVAELDRAGPQGIYARVTTLSSSPERGKRGGADLTASLPALWADIDIAGPGHKHVTCDGGGTCTHLSDAGKRTHRGRVLPLPPDREAARAIVESAYLPPATLWIDSGGGLYPIWKLHPASRVDDLAAVAALSARWQEMVTIAAARLGWHYGTEVGDLSRVLRLPGTWNRKTDEPRLCHVVEHIGGTYTLDDLRELLEQAQADLPTPEPPAPRRPPRERLGGDVKPGTDFAERVDWSDPLLLGGIGWRETYRLGTGERGWLRPGGHSQQSATTGRSGHDNLWVFSSETPFPAQEVISKFEAYRIIHGYATQKEATKALNALGFGSPAIAAGNGKADVGSAATLAPFVWPEDVAGLPEALRLDPGSRIGAQPPAEAAGQTAVEPVTFVGNDLDGWQRKEAPAETVAPEEDAPPDEDDEEEEVDTWLPIDLGPYLRGEIVRVEPALGATRSDGVFLLYPGKEHAIIGEMESGKTFMALWHCAAEMLAQRHVIYVHFEESDPSDTVGRLVSLGCTVDEILTYFHFVGPSQAIKPRQRKRLACMGASLVILDGVNEGMSLHKADIRDENGAAEFRRRIVKPFTKRGAAVASLDHVVKDAEARGRYALGSIHKGNALDGALIVLETREAFGRNQRGASAVYVTKDRPGFLRQYGRAEAAIPSKTFMGMFVVDDTRTRHPGLDVRFWAPVEPDAGSAEEDARSGDEQDDARVMAAIRALSGRNVPATLRHVQAEAGGKATRVRTALDRLVVRADVVEVSGERNSRLFFTIDDPRLSTDGTAGMSNRTVADDAP